MPKITGESIQEHVRAQEQAILDAAARLFLERGFTATTLGDIAGEVGLARNSLYRYFPDKEHILLRWFARETEPFAARTRQILTAESPALDRIQAWVDFQLDYATDPAHALGAQLTGEAESLSAGTRRLIADGHRRLYEQLALVVGEVTGRRAEVELTTALLAALVAEAARWSLEGRLGRRERRRVHAAVRGVLGVTDDRPSAGR